MFSDFLDTILQIEFLIDFFFFFIFDTSLALVELDTINKHWFSVLL